MRKRLWAVSAVLLFTLSTLFLGCGSRQTHGQLIYPTDGYIFPFCTDENPYGITYNSGTTGFAGFPKSEAVGCLNKTPGPVWYYMQIDEPGDLMIYIEQYAISGLHQLDVDFACWGPFEAASKREFLQKTRNSYHFETNAHTSHRPQNGDHSRGLGGYPYDNLVDCSYDPAGTEWCFIPNAKSNEWYLLLITNFSQQPGKIHFERVDEKSTATTRCDVTVPVVINPCPIGLKQINDHTSAICLYEEKALVTIELETEEGFSLSRQSLSRTEVKVYSNDRIYTAHLKDGHFECEIDILSDTTAYYALVDCPDPDFKLETEKHYLVRTADCEPGQIPVGVRDTIRAGSTDLNDFRRGDASIQVDIQHKDDYSGVDLSKYNIIVKENNPFIDEVAVEKEEGGFKLIPKLIGDWCECFIPDSITFHVMLVPVNSDDRAIEIPVTVGVDRPSSWFSYCYRVFAIIAVLLLLLFYLPLLMRKRRFKKCAMANPVHYGRFGQEVNGAGQLLRKKGLGPWIARWFLPGAEKCTLNFSNPRVAAMTFVATESDGQVDVYYAQNNSNSNQPQRLVANQGVAVYHNTVKVGEIRFSPGDRYDGAGYRIFLMILMIVDVAAVLFLLFEMIKALI